MSGGVAGHLQGGTCGHVFQGSRSGSLGCKKALIRKRSRSLLTVISPIIPREGMRERILETEVYNLCERMRDRETGDLERVIHTKRERESNGRTPVVACPIQLANPISFYIQRDI